MSTINFNSNELGNVLRTICPLGSEASGYGKRIFHLTAGYLAVFSKANAEAFAERYNEKGDISTAEEIIADAPSYHNAKDAMGHLRLFNYNLDGRGTQEDVAEALHYLHAKALDLMMRKAWPE